MESCYSESGAKQSKSALHILAFAEHLPTYSHKSGFVQGGGVLLEARALCVHCVGILTNTQCLTGVR